VDVIWAGVVDISVIVVLEDSSVVEGTTLLLEVDVEDASGVEATTLLLGVDVIWVGVVDISVIMVLEDSSKGRDRLRVRNLTTLQYLKYCFSMKLACFLVTAPLINKP